jgi:hypothetical protein
VRTFAHEFVSNPLINQCTHLLIPFLSHSFNQSVHAILAGVLPSLLWPLCHTLEATRLDVSQCLFKFPFIYTRRCSCKYWQNCTVAGEGVQNSQYGILFTLQSQGDTFNDTHKIVSRSVHLPESNVAFMPSQTILKFEQTSRIPDFHSRR